MTPDAERVLRLLNNASVPQADLAFVLGLSIRQVQSALQSLRLEGKPVLSDGDGIRLAATADEARACADALRRRAIRQLLTARALRRTARQMQEAEDAAASLTLWESGPGFARFTAADTPETVEAKMSRAFAPFRAMRQALADLDR